MHERHATSFMKCLLVKQLIHSKVHVAYDDLGFLIRGTDLRGDNGQVSPLGQPQGY
jgi:hypothetical protein